MYLPLDWSAPVCTVIETINCKTLCVCLVNSLWYVGLLVSSCCHFLTVNIINLRQVSIESVFQTWLHLQIFLFWEMILTFTNQINEVDRNLKDIWYHNSAMEIQNCNAIFFLNHTFLLSRPIYFANFLR